MKKILFLVIIAMVFCLNIYSETLAELVTNAPIKYPTSTQYTSNTIYNVMDAWIKAGMSGYPSLEAFNYWCHMYQKNNSLKNLIQNQMKHNNGKPPIKMTSGDKCYVSHTDKALKKGKITTLVKGSGL
ncbi:hypothetical protein KAJ27_17605 [bacterium]|nr:hypothetical protein [bacterium]